MTSKIVTRSRLFMGFTPDPNRPTLLTRTYRLGYVNESEEKIFVYVKIQNDDSEYISDSSVLSAADLERYAARYEEAHGTQTAELLDRLQKAFEGPGTSTFLDRYRTDWDPNIKHVYDECPCGMVHMEGTLGSRTLRP